MLAFTLRRAIQAIGVMIAVGIISFSMFRFRGRPVNQIVALDTSAAERAEIRKSLGLDDPVPVQFARYFANAVAVQVRRFLSVSPAGREPAEGADAGHAGTRHRCDDSGDGVRILMGVYSALRRDRFSPKYSRRCR